MSCVAPGVLSRLTQAARGLMLSSTIHPNRVACAHHPCVILCRISAIAADDSLSRCSLGKAYEPVCIGGC